MISLDGSIIVTRPLIGSKDKIYGLSDNDHYERVTMPADKAAERIVSRAKSVL